MGSFFSKSNPRVFTKQPGLIIDAIHRNDTEFIFNKEDISFHLSSYNWNYLHLAVWMNRFEIVEKLLELGVSLNEQDDNGDTALHLALLTHNKEISQFLIDNGARHDISNNEGFRGVDLMTDELHYLLDYIKCARTETEVENLEKLDCHA